MLSLIQLLISFLCISLIWSHEEPDHICYHDKIEYTTEYLDIEPPKSSNGRLLQEEYRNIRILYDYTGGVFDDSPAEFQAYIKNVVLPPVKNIFESALKVIPSSGNLKTQQLTICSGSISIPSIYNTDGVEADLVLFVDTVNDALQSYAAFASPCVMSPMNNRPIFGRIVYNMAKVRATTTNSVIEKDIAVTLHESTHALGFTSGLFNMFWDPIAKSVLTGHVFTKIVNDQNVTVINLPPLTQRLRNYFDCPTLEGAYLENEGGTGSKGSHFERRILYNEYMTSSTLKDLRMTEFSLAFLEGTGWYQVDYSFAEPMTWGKGKGCMFLDWPCVSSDTKIGRFPEFCSPLKKMTCSWTGRGAGACGASSTRTNANLNAVVDYWGNKTVNSDTFADNCPTIDVYSNLDCEDDTNQLTSTLPTMESYGYGSKCFIGTLISPGMISGPFGYCFKSSCELQSDGRYFVKVNVGLSTVTCIDNGQISVPGLNGKLYCPDPVDFCGRQALEGSCRRKCSARGTCINKLCQCQDGWTLHDCSRKQYLDNCDRCSNKDPYRTTCYGDECVCNPSNRTCMCQLGLKSGLECLSIPTISIGVSLPGVSISLGTGSSTTTDSTSSGSTSTSTTSTGTTSGTSTTSTGTNSTTSTGTTNTTSTGSTSTGTTSTDTTGTTSTNTTSSTSIGTTSTTPTTGTTSTNTTSTGTTSTSTGTTSGTTSTGATSTLTSTSTNTTTGPTTYTMSSNTTFSNGTVYMVTNTTTVDGNKTVTVLNETTVSTGLTSVVTIIKITTITVTVAPNGSKTTSTSTSTTTKTTYIRSNYEDGVKAGTRDSSDEASKVDVVTSNSLGTGVIIAIVVGGIAILGAAIFISIKCVRRFIRHRATKSPIRQPNKKHSVNPVLENRMTNNPTKYEYVP